MSKAKRLDRATLLDRNPIKAAISRNNILCHVRTVRIELHLQEVGTDATPCLAHLGWLLGLAAEVEHAALGITQRLRVVHGALRQVHAMCLSGYAWGLDTVSGMDHAITQAHEALMANPHYAAGFMPGVTDLAESIRSHTVRADQVMGAEIYQTQEEPQT